MTNRSTTVQSNEPPAWARGYIENNLAQTQNTFNRNQPQLQQFADDQRATYGRVAPGAEAGIFGAQKLVNDNLSGKNLNGNPYLDMILGRTRENVTNAVNDQFGPAGRFGSGYHAKILTDELANAENQARFGNYNIERGYQQDAIGQASGLMGGAQGLLTNAAELPWISVNASNGGVRTASNGYGTQTTTQRSSPNWLGVAGAGLQAASMFSDRRLKTDIYLVEILPDGLGVYDYAYLWEPENRRRGVMADEVAVLRPWALGPEVEGYATVNYEAL